MDQRRTPVGQSADDAAREAAVRLTAAGALAGHLAEYDVTDPDRREIKDAALTLVDQGRELLERRSARWLEAVS